jgi:hypothetical protein
MKVKGVLVLLLILLIRASGFGQKIPEIGDKWEDKNPSNFRVFVPSPYGFENGYKVKIDGIEFVLAVDSRQRIVFISCDNPGFKIDNTPYVGRKFGYFKGKYHIRQYPGWGYYFNINEDWSAVFEFTESKLSDSSKITTVFKFRGYISN